MAFFLRKIFFYFSFILIVLFIGDFVITSGLRKTGYNDFEKLAGIFDGSINADLLVMGGSDAKQHFSPLVLDSVLHLNSYNLGLAGHNFMMQYALFQHYLEHNEYPKVVVQTLNVGLLDKREDLYNYQLFLPYLNKEKIAKYTKEYKGLEFGDYYIPFVKYSGELDLIKVGLWEFLGLRNYESITYKGYFSFDDRIWDEKILDRYKENLIEEQRKSLEPKSAEENQDKIFCPELCFHKESVELFESYLIDLKNNNTKVLFILPPSYIEAQAGNEKAELVMDYFSEVASKYDITVFDYSKDSLAYNKDNFYDFAHLNRNASFKFSQQIAETIKEEIN